MSTSISRLRENYKHKKIKILFVAESPPKSADDEVRFFYNPQQERWDYMYKSVMEAVYPDFEYRPGEKDKWLTKFKKCGYYMIDATDSSVNHRLATERRRALNDAVEGKLSEIATLISKRTPIVLIKKNVFLTFNYPLRARGYNVIHDSFLPFPAYGHQKRFIEACRSCLRNHQPA